MTPTCFNNIKRELIKKPRKKKTDNNEASFEDTKIYQNSLDMRIRQVNS